jgi:hypothetical protein
MFKWFFFARPRRAVLFFFGACKFYITKIYICQSRDPDPKWRLWKILDSSAFVTVDEKEVRRKPPEVVLKQPF